MCWKVLDLRYGVAGMRVVVYGREERECGWSGSEMGVRILAGIVRW